ncbi:MAG: hypothetical protein JWM40_1611 [Frankiales bacterium]|nr:hypothetical protein [Frankiales bacterium]
MRIPRPSHPTLVAYTALFLALSGTAYAATGGTFVLGRGNTATAPTGLTSSAGTPMVLNAKTGYAPLAVNSTTKVNRLNADLLDGLDSAALQRRIISTCPQGKPIRAINPNGTLACDDGKTVVMQIQRSINATPGSVDLGVGYAGCPADHAVVGGGYQAGTGPNPPLAIAEVATPMSSFDAGGHRVDGYIVRLRGLDGNAYTGGGTVIAECVFGYSNDEPLPQPPN